MTKVLSSILSCLTLISGSITLFGQSSNIPLDKEYYHTIERLEILEGKNKLNSSVKPYSRKDIGKYTDGLTEKADYSASSLNWIRYENKDWSDTASTLDHQPLFSKVYKQSSSLLSVYTDNLHLHVNPLVSGFLGKEKSNGTTLYRNARGIEVYGSIMKKVGFYTSVTENQVIFPSYINNRIGLNAVIPGEAFWKRFNSNGVDYFNAAGYISFQLLEPIQLQFGYDKQFIGNGYRSLILSDYSAPMAYLKLTTNLWKFSYTNLFTEMTADITTSGGVPNGTALFSKKYMAFHHLNLHIGKKLDVGVFESIIFSREDSLGNGGFELGYLNPLIFYRSVEQNLGSEDNAILGLDFKWNFAKQFSLYGQLVLDELVVKEVLAGNGWWGNKQSGQIGMKYINSFGIDGLDLQGEVNIVRPYMYSHT
ncbi:MAG: hypothetical protein AB8B61_03460, partial [Cyclobacteriaceae bacterium]